MGGCGTRPGKTESTGEAVVFDLKRPCKKCPFRRDIHPFLRRERAEEIAEALLSGLNFYCHETVDYDRWEHEDEEGGSEGEYCPDGEEQHCAGASMMLWRYGTPNQMMRICLRLNLLDPNVLERGDNVFESPEEFIDHHGSEHG